MVTSSEEEDPVEVSQLFFERSNTLDADRMNPHQNNNRKNNKKNKKRNNKEKGPYEKENQFAYEAESTGTSQSSFAPSNGTFGYQQYQSKGNTNKGIIGESVVEKGSMRNLKGLM